MITVKEFAKGTGKTVKEVLEAIKRAGMGVMQENDFLNNTQAMLLLGIFKREEKKEKNDLDYSPEKQQELKRLLAADVIYMDTCSLLLKPKVDYFWQRAEQVFKRNHRKITLPFSVVQELWKHLDNPEKPELTRDAQDALDKIEKMVAKGMVEVLGDEAGWFADQSFLRLIENNRFSNKVLLITEDLNLSMDVLMKNKTRSAAFIPVSVASLGYDGYLNEKTEDELEIRSLKREAREKREQEASAGTQESRKPRKFVCASCGKDITQANEKRIRKGKTPHLICNACFFKEKDQKAQEQRAMKAGQDIKEPRKSRTTGVVGTILYEAKGLQESSKELESLRVFYNGWLSQKESGKKLGELYRLNKIPLDEALENSPRKQEIVKKAWKEYLSPTLKAVKKFEYRSAKNLIEPFLPWISQELGVKLIRSAQPEAEKEAPDDTKLTQDASAEMKKEVEKKEEKESPDLSSEKPEDKHRDHPRRRRENRKRDDKSRQEKEKSSEAEEKTPHMQETGKEEREKKQEAKIPEKGTDHTAAEPPKADASGNGEKKRQENHKNSSGRNRRGGKNRQNSPQYAKKSSGSSQKPQDEAKKPESQRNDKSESGKGKNQSIEKKTNEKAPEKTKMVKSGEPKVIHKKTTPFQMIFGRGKKKK